MNNYAIDFDITPTLYSYIPHIHESAIGVIKYMYDTREYKYHGLMHIYYCLNNLHNVGFNMTEDVATAIAFHDIIMANKDSEQKSADFYKLVCENDMGLTFKQSVYNAILDTRLPILERHFNRGAIIGDGETYIKSALNKVDFYGLWDTVDIFLDNESRLSREYRFVTNQTNRKNRIAWLEDIQEKIPQIVVKYDLNIREEDRLVRNIRTALAAWRE